MRVFYIIFVEKEGTYPSVRSTNPQAQGPRRNKREESWAAASTLCFLTPSTGDPQLLFLLPCFPCYREWHSQTANKTSLSSVSQFCQSSKVNMLGGHSTDCHFYEVYLLINPTAAETRRTGQSQNTRWDSVILLYILLGSECKLNTYNMHILLQINYASIK